MTEKDNAGPGDLLAELDRKLLDIGGTEVVHRQVEPFAEDLLAYGHLIPFPVKQRKGKAGHPDSSAAAIWGRNIDKFHLGTGYALRAGIWAPRSWVVDAKLSLYDTEPPAEKIFGVTLDRHQALQLWLIAYLAERYPGPASLIMALGAEKEPDSANEHH